MIQRIQVNTKGGLIAAFYCCIFTEWSVYGALPERPPDTEIILQRKSGETKFKMKAAWSDDAAKAIRKCIASIRKIPAAELLA